MGYVYERGKGYRARILLDSVGPSGKRITTWELRYPRMVHAELMTHRVLCLAGDSVLEFDLPGGQARTGARRVYKMTIADFVAKWIHGSAPHRSRWGGARTYDMKSRLREMRIRQVDEATGDITTATVKSAIESGLKPVYEVVAGRYRVAGSADHRVLTGGGWKTIGDIRIGDTLVVSTRQKPEALRADPLRLKKIDGRWRSKWQIEQRARMVKDDPRCRTCPEKGTEIHHIVPVRRDPSRAFDPENVTLLCDGCHVDAHRRQGWQEGNPLYSGEAVVDLIRYRGIEPTYDLEIDGPFPNFLANKVVVHNSRNSASSRAIPNEKLVAQVVDDPAMPVWWGKNQSGMQAREELGDVAAEQCRRCSAWLRDELAGLCRHGLDGLEAVHDLRSEQQVAVDAWLAGRDRAVALSRELAACGLHKQIANRVIEPWMFITVVATATEWDNWYALRNHPDAQPEIAYVARMMREAWDLSGPMMLDEGEWHLPLVTGYDRTDLSWGADMSTEDLKWISVGRCARVSYLTHEGKRDPQADVDLARRLSASTPGHWSPFEHVAQAMPDARPSGNFIGWKQFRKEFADEHVGGPRP